jgi:hypothetical protein
MGCRTPVGGRAETTGHKDRCHKPLHLSTFPCYGLLFYGGLAIRMPFFQHGELI